MEGKLKERHFADTSVYMSVALKDENLRDCERYFSRVENGIFELWTSPLVIGEAFMVVVREAKKSRKIRKEDAFDVLARLFKLAKIFVPTTIGGHISSLEKASVIENWTYTTDVRILSEAIESDAQKFITTREKIMTQNKSLKKYITVERVKDVLRL